MPEDHCRMISEAFRQFLVDDPYLFPVNRRCIAVIVSGSKKLPSSGLIHPKHFRIFISQPFWTGTGGCRKDHADSFRIKPVNHLFHPVQTEHALFRFQGRPGENAKAHYIAAGFYQHFHILFQNIRSIQPLIRIVISAMKKHICLEFHFLHPPLFLPLKLCQRNLCNDPSLSWRISCFSPVFPSVYRPERK